MKSKKYELTILLDLPEEDKIKLDIMADDWYSEQNDTKSRALIEAYSDIIERYGGFVINVSFEGYKRIPYPVNNIEYSAYIYLDIMLPEDKVSEFSQLLNIQRHILRYLLVKADN